MLGILITKELKAILLSPKFIATFAVCTVVLLLSVGIGIQEYFQSKAQYESSAKLFDQQTRESTSYSQLRARVHRIPDPMQVFVSGLTWDIGRWSDPSNEAVSRLHQSPYSDDPIFAIFRMIDFAFVVQIVFSLFAVLFTFDAISGEREQGTLKLVFSHAVPRAKYIIAKAVGSWMGLVAPMTLAVLVAVLMVMLSGVPMTGTNWLQLGLLLGVSLLYFTFFIVLGVCVSALSRQSSVSFLVALVFWVVFVLIIPRAGALAAAQMVSVPSVAEIEGQKEAFARDRWQKFMDDITSHFENRSDSTTDDEMWTRLEHQDSLRKATERDIDAHEAQLFEDLRRRKESQERLALSLSRVSPSSAYQLAAMTLAGTGLSLEERYEQAIDTYRGEITKYKEAKAPNDSDVGRLMITVDSDKGLKISQGRSVGSIDVSDMPGFQPIPFALRKAASAVVVDVGLLLFYTLGAFVLAFARFTRYDVR